MSTVTISWGNFGTYLQHRKQKLQPHYPSKQCQLRQYCFFHLSNLEIFSHRISHISGIWGNGPSHTKLIGKQTWYYHSENKMDSLLKFCCLFGAKILRIHENKSHRVQAYQKPRAVLHWALSIHQAQQRHLRGQQGGLSAHKCSRALSVPEAEAITQLRSSLPSSLSTQQKTQARLWRGMCFQV